MDPLTSIVVYGQDAQLLETRYMVFKQAGFLVHKATSLSEVEAMVARQETRLLLVCHSVPSQDCGAAVEMAAMFAPAMKTLCLTAGRPACSEPSMSAFEGPRRLVEVVGQLCEAPRANPAELVLPLALG